VRGEGWDGLVTPDHVEELAASNFLGTSRGRRPSAPAIRRILIKLVFNNKLHRDLSQWGRKYVAGNFDVKVVVRRTLELYEAVLESYLLGHGEIGGLLGGWGPRGGASSLVPRVEGNRGRVNKADFRSIW